MDNIIVYQVIHLYLMEESIKKVGGGGVGLYVKNNLNFHECNDVTIMNEKIFESIFNSINLAALINKTLTVRFMLKRSSGSLNKENL